MVVAAGTANRQPDKSTGGGANHVVQFIGSLLGRQSRIRAFHAIHRPGHQKTRGIVSAHAITRQLLEQKLFEWFIFVERANDIIPIRPGIRAWLVCFKPITLGKLDHIQPVSCPTFTKVG